MDRKQLLGIVLAALAGFFWGSMSIAAQFLMENCGFGAVDLTTLRLAGAGLLLLTYTGLVKRSNIFAPLHKRKNLFDITVYGLGLLVIQLTFFLSIECSNAATAALMVTTGPLFVIAWTAFAEKRRVLKVEWLALLLATGGVALIVTKGRLDTVDLSIEGAFWGILSAAAGAFCTIQPKAVMQRVPIDVLVGWGMTIGGAVLWDFSPADLFSMVWSPTSGILYFYIVAFGTVGAFCCYLKSLEYVPAPVTALLNSFEPLSAVVLGVTLLGLVLNAAEIIGIVLIFCMVATLALRR